MREGPETGVTGTISAFNFIRRVGFPSTPEVLTIFSTIAFLTAFISLPISGETLSGTLIFAAGVLIGPAIIGESVNSMLTLYRDHVLSFRRLMGLEVVSLLPLAVTLPVSSVVGVLTDNSGLWVDGFLTGFITSLPLRFLTIEAVSFLGVTRKILAATFPPILNISAYLMVATVFTTGFSSRLLIRSSAILLLGLVLAGIGVYWLIKSVEKAGLSEIRDSPMGMFRAFLDHWLTGKSEALEKRLSDLGTERSVEIRILSFIGRESSPKGSLIVSNFHPGPYRDLGSAGLPSELKDYLERSVGGVVLVPHGISDHRLNIISRHDIGKMLQAAKENYPSGYDTQKASAVVQASTEEAKVRGQAFGNVALLTVTLSPVEMEDLPLSVQTDIESEASRRDFEVLTVDAHNSLSNQTSITSEQAERIVRSATKVLDALQTSPQSTIEIGVAEDPLTEFTLEEGIGPGGLSVLTVKSGEQVTAYIAIDGNNMQTGLREEILESMRADGVTDAEVMTTDTHLVAGLVRSALGYYPVGSHLNKGVLIGKIANSVRRACNDMEASSVGFSKFSLRLGVLGSETFTSVTGFVGRIARRIAKSFYWLELSSLVLGLAILWVL